MQIWNRKSWLVAALLITGVTVGCGKKNAAEEDKSITPLAADESLKLPAEGDPGTINLLETPAGSYKIVKIQTYRVNAADKTRGLFVHDANTVGKPAKGDPFRMKYDWASIDKSKVQAQILVELNLPLEVVATGSAVEFKDKRYYWDSLFSDESWSWSITLSESPKGLRFHDTFTSGTRAGKTFDAPTLTSSDVGKGIATLNGTDLTIFVEIKASHGDVVVVAITYRK